jgi:hypothetical protein
MRLSTPLATFLLTAVVALDAQQAPALRIIVLAGEGAVNIIQQQTAVRPLVEVRDRNNLPVAGATVTFSIGGGGSGAAFAGGAQTLSVTTNAVGQAAASGVNALSSGALQIQVQAAYQGQLATAAISQTNFATAAAAAQAGAGAGTGTTGAAGGAAGGGGGMSATTIGIVGAAVAGGAIAATQLTGQQGQEPVADAFDIYRGSLSGQLIVTSTSRSPEGRTSVCLYTKSLTGSMIIDLKQDGTGVATMELVYTDVAVTGGCTGSGGSFLLLRDNTPVTGGPSAISFGGTTAGYSGRFTGALSGNTINGTLVFTATTGPSLAATYDGETTLQVTLQGPRP